MVPAFFLTCHFAANVTGIDVVSIADCVLGSALGAISQMLIVSLVSALSQMPLVSQVPYCNGFATLDASVTGAAGVSGVAPALCATAACVSLGAFGVSCATLALGAALVLGATG